MFEEKKKKWVILRWLPSSNSNVIKQKHVALSQDKMKNHERRRCQIWNRKVSDGPFQRKENLLFEKVPSIPLHNLLCP